MLLLTVSIAGIAPRAVLFALRVLVHRGRMAHYPGAKIVVIDALRHIGNGVEILGSGAGCVNDGAAEATRSGTCTGATS